MTHTKTHDTNTCLHTFKRVSRSASHLHGLGSGSGYFQVGVFDTVITCRDCKAVLDEVKESAPLCQCCLQPLMRVSEVNGIASCGDLHTDSLLFGTDLRTEKVRQRARIDHYWDWHCAREEREEERRKDTPQEMSFSERVTRAGIRILRRSTLKQIWPYVCTNHNCNWQGRLVWLHTPGD